MHKPKATYTKECEVCGKSFGASRSDARICGGTCRKKKQNALNSVKN